VRLADLIVHAKRTARSRGERHRVRKPARLPPALSIELSYARAIEARYQKLFGVVKRTVLPRIETISRRAGVRLDDWTDDIDGALRLARATYNGIAPPGEIEQTALEYAQQTNSFQRRSLKGVIDRAAKVNVFFNDAGLLTRMRGFVKQNVQLIGSVEEEYLGDLKNRLMTGIRAGDRVEELRDMIEERFDVTRGRASVIARDQVGAFYGELNRARQTELGIAEYDWSGVLDQRERQTHRALEGRRFAWNDPPVTNKQGDRNNPGGDYQCRCTGSPVLPDVSL
jgi:SPP1 gp7 family putative phage head morphogenesis protein